ncbi:cell division protein ZipA [uncultured Psychrosphaera sp.]|uniref:cell division protein ZipA n=1 Tax=uncultured Psychrosphaera sp. TaxID=1403522 RepID=UPI00261A2A6D|nr:cell division protein ZipA [uncultured Psychrosphaera sp.]
MAEELRLALILLGTLAIGSVILHGIWTVRRTVSEERKNAKIEAEEAEPVIALEEQEMQKLKLKQMEMNFSELQLRKNEQTSGSIPVKKMNLDSIYHNEQEPRFVTDVEENETGLESSQQQQQVVDISNVDTEYSFTNKFEADEVSDDYTPSIISTNIFDDEEPQQPRFKQRETSALDDTPEAQKTEASKKAPDAPKYNDERLQHKLDAQPSLVEPIEAKKTEVEDKKVEVEKIEDEIQEEVKQEVFMLFVDKPEGTPIDGAKLLPLLLTLGFKYGEMDLFHRHKDTTGRGDILFSLANMYNPGTFDIDNMEQVTTRGLTIFMTLPNSAAPLPTFNMMHNAAKKIADEFSARVLDDQRRPLDVAIVRSYVERIRRF